MGPRNRLLGLFLVAKGLILLVAFCSPGDGYDTSATLILSKEGSIAKLVRWDAIYFTQIASRGYTFEQEWAFGWGLTRLLSAFGTRKEIAIL